MLISLAVTKLTSIVTPYFSAVGPPCDPEPAGGFFSFPTWWKYLGGHQDPYGNCVPTADFTQGLEPIWAIALAIADMLLRIAGIIAVGYIIFAGYVYVRSVGSSEKTAAAKSKLTNAIVGLIIVLLASAMVTFVGSRLGG